MKNHYGKGARAERELMEILFRNGFQVARIAGSGKNKHDCPDVIAIKNGVTYILECKAWAQTRLYVRNEQIEGLYVWLKQGALPFVAWKVPRKGWYLFPPAIMSPTDKSWTISLAEAIQGRSHVFFDETNPMCISDDNSHTVTGT